MVMSFPPLQPISDFHSYVSGDVTIDPSAAIAPGVLLQADPDSQIAIAAGACIGMGSVLHANQGLLIVEKGATLGAGVLLVGRVKIGANACVGSVTTILNRDVDGGMVVPPGSLLGDESRQVSSESGEIEEEKVYSAATQASVNSAVARNAIANPTISQSVQIDEVAVYSSATQASVNSAVARNAIANPMIPQAAPTDGEIADSPVPQTSTTGNEAIAQQKTIPESDVQDKAGTYSSATQASINSAVARNVIANPTIPQAAPTDGEIADSPVPQTSTTGNEAIAQQKAIPQSDVQDKAGTYSSATQASINSAVARNAIANASQLPINASTTVIQDTDSPESTPKSDELSSDAEQTSESEDAKRTIVYGQQHLERLMGTLFPYQSRNNQNGQVK